MKGKIVYIAEVEKEIEIPDEIMAIKARNWYNWTEEEEKKVEEFSESVWGEIPWEKRCGMYCGHAALEEY